MSTTTPSTESLRALYYPYSRCLNEDTLKRAVLIFDEVWFADHFSEQTRAAIRDEDDSPDTYFGAQFDNSLYELWIDVKPHYELLVEHGAVKYYNLDLKQAKAKRAFLVWRKKV